MRGRKKAITLKKLNEAKKRISGVYNTTKKKNKRKSKQLEDKTTKILPTPNFYALRISNIVSTAYVGEPLVLRFIQLAAQSRLDESVFPSSVSRLKQPDTTISFFDTGRILCTGSPSIDYALLSVLLFVEKINRKLGKNYQVINFVVQNIVSSFSLGYRLNIDMFYTDNKSTAEFTCQYDPALARKSYKHNHCINFVLCLFFMLFIVSWMLLQM